MSAHPLPRSAPSAQGVDAARVLAFLDAVGSAGFDFHSLMLVRHGHVVAEGWWAPYRADRVHLLYSLSKAFTSTAIGMAEAEGLLSIEDRVVQHFADKTPADASPHTQAMKVRHLLSMSSGHAEDTRRNLGRAGTDLVRGFLSIPPDQEPGTLFCYNQGCTYTLSALITRLTGERLLDYLRPRLLDPLGIEQAFWTQSDEGIDQGYTGLHLVTESVAKLGLLHLQNGRWEGRQLVPSAYMAEAHRLQIEHAGSAPDSDWQQGYGFQFWMCRHGAYRGDGAFGQFCVMVPAADAVIACTAQVTEMQAQLDLIWEHLLPALSGDVAADPVTERRLADRLSHLSTPVIQAMVTPPDRTVTFDRVGEPVAGTEQLSGIRVESAGGCSELIVLFDQKEHRFGLEPGGFAEGDLSGQHQALRRVAVTGGWTAADQFEADVVSTTTPHRLQLRAKIGPPPTLEASWYAAPL